LLSLLGALLAAPPHVVAFGDAMFDRGVRHWLAGRPADSVLCRTALLRRGKDVVLLNLETPLCEASLPSRDKRISLRSDRDVAQALRRAGFTHAGLANNHVLDRGREGLAQTIASLQAAGVVPVGASLSGDPCTPVLTKDRGMALLAWTDLPVDGSMVCADLERVTGHLERLRREGIPALVFAHWGIEFSAQPSRRQRDVAALLAKAGAGAVVGHHPHINQPMETVGSVPVWFSLGNFVFDQKTPGGKTGMAAILTPTGKGWTGSHCEVPASWR
jgi:poly-gamma-glutamate synthesis protein (capsule biosynthesis protein)